MTTAEQSELMRLRRGNRHVEMENEILRRAAAYFSSSTLSKSPAHWSVTWPPKDSRCG